MDISSAPPGLIRALYEAHYPMLDYRAFAVAWPYSAEEIEQLHRFIKGRHNKLMITDFPDGGMLVEVHGVIGEPILKPSTLKRAYTQAELDAAVMAERERCAALVDPNDWESLHPSDGEYLILEEAARKIRGD